MKSTKQVIVIRKDLNMRKGKMCAQASHASMAFLTKQANFINGNLAVHNSVIFCHRHAIYHWLTNSFRKICVYVESEEELEDVHKKALDQGLMSHLIEDNGATEFNGVKTKTCLAIGPHWDEEFVGITDHLPLL